MRNPRIILLIFACVIALIGEFAWVVPQSNSYHKDWDENMSVMVALGRRDYKVPERKPITNVQLWGYNTYPNVVKSTIEDNSNALLYYSVLHCFLNPGELSFSSGRTLPNITYFLSIIFFSLLAFAILKNLTWSVVATILFASHNQLMMWSATSRTYSTVLFLTLASSYFLILIIQAKQWKKSWVWAYCIFCSLAFLAHYFAIMMMFSGAVALLITFGWKDFWKITKLYIAIAVIPMSWFIIGGYVGLKQMVHLSATATTSHSGWLPEVGDKAYRWKYLNLLYISLTNEWPHWALLSNIKARYVYAFSYLPFVFLLVFFIVWYIKQPKLNQPLTVLILLSLLPIYNLFVSLVSGNNISLFPKYSLMAVPYIVLLLVVACHTLYTSQKIAFKITGASVMLLLMVLYLSYFPANYKPVIIEKDAYQIAAENIIAKCQPTDTLLFPTWEDANITASYLPLKQPFLLMYDYKYRSQQAIFIIPAGGQATEFAKLTPDFARSSWE